MKAKTFTQQPVIPPGYTGRDINNWYKHLEAQYEKLYPRYREAKIVKLKSA